MSCVVSTQPALLRRARLTCPSDPPVFLGPSANLYTFSPLSALITHHKVETVHPTPGEGVGAWLASWRGAGSGGMGGGGGGKPRTAEEGQGCTNAVVTELEQVRVRVRCEGQGGPKGSRDERGAGSSR